MVRLTLRILRLCADRWLFTSAMPCSASNVLEAFPRCASASWLFDGDTMVQVSGKVTRDVSVRTKKGKNCPWERALVRSQTRRNGKTQDIPLRRRSSPSPS